MSAIQQSILSAREALRAIQMDFRLARLVWENKRPAIRVMVPAGQAYRLIDELKDPTKKVLIPIHIIEMATPPKSQDDDNFAFG